MNVISRRRTHSNKASKWTSKPLPKVAEKVTKKKEAEEEKVKASLLSEVAALWQPTSEKADERHIVESEVDFDQEGFLGKTFHLRNYRVSMRRQINGIWVQHIDSEPEEVEPGCQFSLNIGLKVPVEEAFVGTGEPTVAFFDEQKKVWLKNVYTTNSHYDMSALFENHNYYSILDTNTSTVHVQISKFGRIALFQRTNFHFPYRKWTLDFSSNHVSLMISTNFVELTFLFDQQTISVDVGSNIEFSKLKLINGKGFSLPEMARVQFVRWPDGSYGVNGSDSMVLLQLAKRNVRDVQISSLFRWLMLTRAHSSVESNSDTWVVVVELLRIVKAAAEPYVVENPTNIGIEEYNRWFRWCKIPVFLPVQFVTVDRLTMLRTLRRD
uniref:Beta-mannosidase n=1 Tax=Ascaris lumbricoides TaxID=6252 RepID=A0A0M3I5U1_ASCLU